MKTSKASLLADGLNVAWSPDAKSFCTGEGRSLSDLDSKRQVWVSRLHVVSLAEGRRRTLVEGLVSVDGLDWRPVTPAARLGN